MESKLKALKVTELKEILQKASIPPGNAKKQDLINKIIANPSAIEVFHTLHPGKKPVPADDDLLAPPEEIDWAVEEAIPVVPPSPPKQAPASPPKPKQPLSPPVPVAEPPAPAPADEESEKRKARAARFGTTLVDPKQPSPQQPKKVKVPSGEDADKLKARAERFGMTTSVTKTSGKRVAPIEQVDPEEQERRRKRAERFGLPLSDKA
ncbi:uncharacterized protein EDB91DRAFT_567836 [Suillus paluster]|uniref:uncharacterized protein n=1 Tax=Suillus paluster TaxID=48578 RepID=UPI001B86531E|nr:uncharacterized protein EDB91DRAFT_567836 [Suillus paluster]KAG1735079.1 hypothetical protein EDB91DRAFT_567836 [Suillus paluster]